MEFVPASIEPDRFEMFARFTPAPITVVVVFTYPNLVGSFAEVAVTLTRNVPEDGLVTLRVNILLSPAFSNTDVMFVSAVPALSGFDVVMV